MLYRETGVIFNVSRGQDMSNRIWALGMLLCARLALADAYGKDL